MGTRRVIAQNVIVTAPGVFPVYTNPLSCLVWSASENDVRVRNLIALQLRNFRVRVPVAAGLGNAYVYTIRVAGADTDLQLIIPDDEVESEPLNTVIEASPNQWISMKLSAIGSPAPHAGHLQWLDVCGVNRGESWFAMNGSVINADPKHTTPFSANLWDTQGDDIIYNLAPVPGRWATLVVDVVTPPGLGASWEFAVTSNGSPVGTITIADLETSGELPLDLDVAVLDRLSIGSTPINGPADTIAGIAVKFVSDVDGESPYCGFSIDQPSTSVANYNFANANSANTYQSNEANRLTHGGPTRFTLRRLHARFFNPLGASSFTLALQKNNLGAGPTVTTSGTNSDLTGQASIGDGDTFDMQTTPHAPAFSQYMSWGMAQYSISPPPNGIMGDYAWVHVRTREGIVT